MSSNPDFADAGLVLLKQAWVDANARENIDAHGELAEKIDQVFAAATQSYAKAAIVQTLGKATMLGLNALTVQKGLDDDSAWDARTFARATFVPWNEESRPFTHTADPYVSNPLRIPRFDAVARQKARDKDGFDALVALLTQIEAADSEQIARNNLVEVLVGLRRFLSDKSVEYPLPLRASIETVIGAVERYLSEKSGGARLQAIVAALFNSLLAAGFRIKDVSAGHINAADAGTGRGGDVEFQGGDARFAIEVKDRPLTKDEFIASIEKARVAEVSDLMFVVRSSLILDANFENGYFSSELRKQFSSGLNIYVERFDQFLKIVLSLIGESGRHGFLQEVGSSLENQSAQIGHKWAWASIVKSL